MMEKMLFFLPDSFMALGIALIGVGLIVGIFSIRRALRLVGIAVLLMVSNPFIDALIDYLWRILPTWLLLLLGAMFALAVVRFVSRMVLGRRAAAEMLGILAADVVRGVFRAMFRVATLPFRVLNGRRGGRTVHG